MLTLLVFLLATGAPWEWLAVWIGSLAIFLYKHRADYRRRPRMQDGWLALLFRKLSG